MKTNAMRLTSIELFQILKQKIGEKEAQSLVDFVEAKVFDEFDSQKNLFATKEDLVKVQGVLETKLESSKNQIIIWIVGTMIVLIGLLKLLS